MWLMHIIWPDMRWNQDRSQYDGSYAVWTCTRAGWCWQAGLAWGSLSMCVCVCVCVWCNSGRWSAHLHACAQHPLSGEAVWKPAWLSRHCHCHCAGTGVCFHGWGAHPLAVVWLQCIGYCCNAEWSLFSALYVDAFNSNLGDAVSSGKIKQIVYTCCWNVLMKDVLQVFVDSKKCVKLIESLWKLRASACVKPASLISKDFCFGDQLHPGVVVEK